jgi:hypothetical protein
MRNHIRRFEIVVLALLVTSLPWISSCSEQSETTFRIWIDTPLQGSEYQPGDPIRIISHIYANEEIEEVLISINGQPVKRNASPGPMNPAAEVNHEWIPDQPGNYTIEVSVTDKGGITRSKSQVDVAVLDLLKPDLVVTDLSLVGEDRVRCEFTNQGAAVLPQGLSFWIDVLIGPSDEASTQIAHSNVGTGDFMAAGDHRSFTTAPISPIPEWPQIVTCIIDTGNLIDEDNENNNQIQTRLIPPSPTPTSTPTATPTITPTATSAPFRGEFGSNAFCRKGPGTDYDDVTAFEAGHVVELEARSEPGIPLWWYVHDLQFNLYCWVSGSVIETDVDPDLLPVRASPSLPTRTPTQIVCRSDLTEDQCIQAGGTWERPLAGGTPYCKCPTE